jgi:hypothetical protein
MSFYGLNDKILCHSHKTCIKEEILCYQTEKG